MLIGSWQSPKAKEAKEHRLGRHGLKKDAQNRCDRVNVLETAIATSEDNTSKDPFSLCENLQTLQGIHTQVKSEYVGTLTTSEVMTRMQSDKHNNMFNVAANLKHVNTHKNNN